jgi:hypothetical protein
VQCGGGGRVPRVRWAILTGAASGPVVGRNSVGVHYVHHSEFGNGKISRFCGLFQDTPVFGFASYCR